MRKRLGLVGAAAALLIAAPLFGGLADGAASGRVIGMTSGGGSKGHGVVDISPGLSGKRVHQVMTITTPIDNVEVGGTGVFKTTTGGQLTATLSDSSVSCQSFTTGMTTWTGSGKVAFVGPTGSFTMKFAHYSLTFWHGVSYANERASVTGGGVQNGSETGLDSFYKGTGFSCSTAGSGLKSLSVVGVLKITTRRQLPTPSTPRDEVATRGVLRLSG